MRGNFISFHFCFVAFDHLCCQGADTWFESFCVKQLRCYWVNVHDQVGVIFEGGKQLVKLTVTSAMANQGIPLQTLLFGLAQEQSDVGVVARVQDHIGTRTAQLGHQGRQVGGCGSVAFFQDHLHAQLFAYRVVA